jgi:hypothetical protein
MLFLNCDSLITGPGRNWNNNHPEISAIPISKIVHCIQIFGERRFRTAAVPVNGISSAEKIEIRPCNKQVNLTNLI